MNSILTISIILIILLFLSAFFSSSETAFTSINMIRIRKLADDGDKRAKNAIDVAENFEKSLAAILIGNNIVNNLTTIIFTFFMTVNYPKFILFGSVILIVFMIVFSEIIPKNLAKYNADAFALAQASTIKLLVKIVLPLVSPFEKINKLFKSNHKENPTFTEEEFLTMVDTIEEEGIIDEDEKELIQSVIQFNDATANEIKIPRHNIIHIDIATTSDEAMKIILEEQYSRYPVYADNPDNIIGILYAKDILKLLFEKKEIILKNIIKPAIFISNEARLPNILKQLQENNAQMAIVLNEYGVTDGLVTMEDVLEELIGEIFDEHDEVIDEILEISPNTFEVVAETDLNDFFEKYLENLKIPETNYPTLGGWAYEKFETIPELGDTFIYENIAVCVIELDGRRISKLKIEIIDRED